MDPFRWTRQYETNGLIVSGSDVNGPRVDGSKGHATLNWSLCGLQETLNGNDLRLMINPSP